MFDGARSSRQGSLLAFFAAVSFGATTPFIERAGRGLGALSTAALLYAGACLSAFVLGRLFPSVGAPLKRAHVGRLVWVALFGAGIAPTLFTWGLQRSGATVGSLLLNLEAVFTALCAWVLFREQVGARLKAALGLICLGGITLGLGEPLRNAGSALGVLAICGATLAWSIDNALTRGLAELDPVRVVAGKGALGAVLTSVTAVALGEPVPGLPAAFALLVCGATGYGVSLRLYLSAQRRLGAARTGAIFALAPFIGAALAWTLGDKLPGPWSALSAALFGLGVLLQVTERHGHGHVHPALEHEHPHRHDDGHHSHPHDPPIHGEHSHPHRHERLEHEHAHTPDVHHGHAH